MSLRSFLYRRLSRWITCEFNLQNQGKISLRSKYEIASFKDVFCHPFYWQVAQWINKPPALVVDCGAHCAHFSILADICFSNLFGSSDTQYILIEPNPFLIPIIQKNTKELGMDKRTILHQGLLGQRFGKSTLWVDHKNYLATGLNPTQHAEPFEVPFIDLPQIIKQQTIDLMKIDIEGGEFDFISENLPLFEQVNLIFMELHTAAEERHKRLFQQLASVGLNLVAEPMYANGQQLLIFKR
jgi:FkbM family methyltransferase